MLVWYTFELHALRILKMYSQANRTSADNGWQNVAIAVATSLTGSPTPPLMIPYIFAARKHIF